MKRKMTNEDTCAHYSLIKIDLTQKVSGFFWQILKQQQQQKGA